MDWNDDPKLRAVKEMVNSESLRWAVFRFSDTRYGARVSSDINDVLSPTGAWLADNPAEALMGALVQYNQFKALEAR
jgi:hypothetical protein